MMAIRQPVKVEKFMQVHANRDWLNYNYYFQKFLKCSIISARCIQTGAVVTLECITISCIHASACINMTFDFLTFDMC